MEVKRTWQHIHSLARLRFPKEDRCEHCLKPKRLQWSNKLHDYKVYRDNNVTYLKREEWQALCASCHKLYDINVLKVGSYYKELRHGTYAGYCRGCRCAYCRLEGIYYHQQRMLKLSYTN